MLKRLYIYYKERYPLLARLLLGMIVFGEIYFIILLTVIIEIAFFYAYDPLCTWLVPNFGADDFTWRIVILVANLLILLYPLVRLVKSLRFTLFVIDAGRKKIEAMDSVKEKEKSIKFHETMSPLLMGAAIDIIVVMLVPNGIDNMVHIYVSSILLALLIVIQIVKFKMGRKGPAPDLGEDDESKLATTE